MPINIQKKERSPSERPPGKWMNPLNKLIWIEAFRKKRTLVTLPGGMVFKCDYKKKPGLVWVCPANTKIPVPCGWFDLDVVTKESWIESDKFVRKSNVDD
jgi:hypothetical protein